MKKLIYLFGAIALAYAIWKWYQTCEVSQNNLTKPTGGIVGIA